MSINAFNNGQQQFKTFNRRRRAQYSEESFAKGIKYVTSPLDLGYCRNMINYDLGQNGLSLLPRQGLRVHNAALASNSTVASTIMQNLDKYQIVFSTEITEDDGKTYGVVLIGSINDNQTGPVKVGDMYVVTLAPGTQENYFTNTEEILKSNCYIAAVPGYAFYYNNPDKATIHGMEVANPQNILNPIGTVMSAEGTTRYYAFAKNTSTNKNVPMLLTFDNSSKHYGFVALDIMPTTAYQASSGMFNMLQDNPYTFADRYAGGTLQLMGCIVYNTDGTLATTQYVNKEYDYRINYQVPKNGKYKIAWEWKEVGSSSFTLIEEQIYDFTQTTPPQIKLRWSSPVEAAILQVQVYPYASETTIVNLATFGSAPSNPTNGTKYYNSDTHKIYTYNGSGWDGGFLPLTSCYYKRLDENNHLYRWLGNAMGATDMYDYIASHVMMVNITAANVASDSAVNTPVENYDLGTCKGMVTWKQRIGVYAPNKGANMLFLSEPNNPAWFPYPRNVSLFSEDIIKCVEYLDYLLVFTTDALYQLVQGDDGDSWSEVCLQKNLKITPSDVPLIKIIKNMVFFKSNNYFYMVVPSASSTTGLSVAAISENIELLLDNFEEAIEEILHDTYDNNRKFELLRFKNFVDYKNVYNQYTFSTVSGKKFNYYLIYNIESRYWYSRIIESETWLDIFKIDVADVNVYTSLGYIDNNQFVIQLFKFHDENCHDMYLRKGMDHTIDISKYNREHTEFPNYQLIDTGYREHESDFKKRFRELQFKLNNYAQLDLRFYTEFMIDGYLRQHESAYEIHQIIDKDDPRFGVISYDRVYGEEAGHFVPGATILGETPLLPDDKGRFYQHNPEETTRDKLMWKLDVSEFPETVFWKVRFPVSGKGYVPRLKILNMDQERYEMLNISWVYRMLYSR